MYNSGSDQKPSEKEKPDSPESQCFFTLINNERLQVLMGRRHYHSYAPGITESIHTGA